MILLLYVIILLLIIIGFILYQRLKKAEQRANLLIEKHEALSNKIDNIKLENLESRLNPHLFKNILNSI
jgi:CHASE3 domain sensor protein